MSDIFGNRIEKQNVYFTPNIFETDILKKVRALMKEGYIPYSIGQTSESFSYQTHTDKVTPHEVCDGHGGYKVESYNVEHENHTNYRTYVDNCVCMFRYNNQSTEQKKHLIEQLNELEREQQRYQNNLLELKSRSLDAANEYINKYRSLTFVRQNKISSLTAELNSANINNKLLTMNDEELFQYLTGLSLKRNTVTINQRYTLGSVIMGLAVAVFFIGTIVLTMLTWAPLTDSGHTLLAFFAGFLISLFLAIIIYFLGWAIQEGNKQDKLNYGYIPDKYHLFEATANQIKNDYQGETLLSLDSDIAKWMNCSGYLK